MEVKDSTMNTSRPLWARDLFQLLNELITTTTTKFRKNISTQKIRDLENEVALWKKATGRDDPDQLDFELGRDGIDSHLRVLARIKDDANFRFQECLTALRVLEPFLHKLGVYNLQDPASLPNLDAEIQARELARFVLHKYTGK